MDAEARTRTLADGNEIPMLGLGVWQVKAGDEAENSVRWALEMGYRHVDTAQAYGNEESVGQALREKRFELLVEPAGLKQVGDDDRIRGGAGRSQRSVGFD